MDGSVFIRRKKLSGRYTVLVLALILGFSVVAVRLFVLCILQHDKYQSMADDNIFSELKPLSITSVLNIYAIATIAAMI